MTTALFEVKDGRAIIPPDSLSVFVFADLIRRAEQEALRLYHAGHIAGTVHTCIGQEVCQLAVARALLPQDHLLSNHRNHGHLLAYSGDFAGFFAEITGRQGALCGGRGGSQHMATGNFHSNGVQGGMTAIADGLALAARLDRSNAIAAVMLGDGTLGEGLVYEAMNLAALWCLPVLFTVENNGISQTTPTHSALAGTMLARGEAFGLRTYRFADHNPDFIENVEYIVNQVRDSRRPCFLVIDTVRLGPHSKGDDLRPKSEIEALTQVCALNQLRERLPAHEVDEVEEQNTRFIRATSQEVLNVRLAGQRLPAPIAPVLHRNAPPDLDSRRSGIASMRSSNRRFKSMRSWCC